MSLCAAWLSSLKDLDPSNLWPATQAAALPTITMHTIQISDRLVSLIFLGAESSHPK